jgi:hypothetical protein
MQLVYQAQDHHDYQLQSVSHHRFDFFRRLNQPEAKCQSGLWYQAPEQLKSFTIPSKS